MKHISILCIGLLLSVYAYSAGSHGLYPDGNKETGCLKPSGMFGDNAVFQRGVYVPVWGKARPGATVDVTFHGKSYNAVADNTGKWEIRLSPMEASDRPSELEIHSEGETVKFGNILVGDVWFASGQSNMAYMMKEGLS